jgi:hypothetical protein
MRPGLLIFTALIFVGSGTLSAGTPQAPVVFRDGCVPPLTLYQRLPSQPLSCAPPVWRKGPTIHSLKANPPAYAWSPHGPPITIAPFGPPPVRVGQLATPHVQVISQTVAPPCWVPAPHEQPSQVAAILASPAAFGAGLTMPGVTICQQPLPLPPVFKDCCQKPAVSAGKQVNGGSSH